MKILWRLGLLLTAGLVCANLGAADTIVSPPDSQSNADLEAEIEALFGSGAPFWTTSGNIAEIDYLLGIASGLDYGDELTPELQVVLEDEDSSGGLPLDTSPGFDSSSDNSEPDTLVLLGGGLFILLWGATTVSSIRRRLNTS